MQNIQKVHLKIQSDEQCEQNLSIENNTLQKINKVEPLLRNCSPDRVSSHPELRHRGGKKQKKPTEKNTGKTLKAQSNPSVCYRLNCFPKFIG